MLEISIQAKQHSSKSMYSYVVYKIKPYEHILMTLNQIILTNELKLTIQIKTNIPIYTPEQRITK